MDNIEFLNWIAQGFNPYTGEKFSDGDLLRNSAVVLRLNELTNELSTENSDTVQRNAIKITFPYTSIQPFAKDISFAIYNAVPFGTIQNKILSFLREDKKLEFRYRTPQSERMVKFATCEGEKIGIINSTRIDPYGREQHIILYTPTAQKYIIENLHTILKDALY